MNVQQVLMGVGIDVFVVVFAVGSYRSVRDEEALRRRGERLWLHWRTGRLPQREWARRRARRQRITVMWVFPVAWLMYLTAGTWLVIKGFRG